MSEAQGAEVAWDRVIAAERERDEAIEQLRDHRQAWRNRAEAAARGRKRLLLELHEAETALARVREWVEEHDSITGNPWVIQCAREVLAVLDGEDE